MEIIPIDIQKTWINAALTDDLKTIKSLYKTYGKDIINIYNDTGSYNAFLLATYDKNGKQVFDFLLKQPDLDVNTSISGINPLIAALNYKTSYKLKKLLKHPNIQINKLTRVGTILSHVCKYSFSNKIEIISILLNNSDLNVNLAKPIFELVDALDDINSCNIKILKMLLTDKRINLNVENYMGQDFIDKLSTDNKYFLGNYQLQKTIIENNYTNIQIFHKHNIIHHSIQKEYAHLIRCHELNLL